MIDDPIPRSAPLNMAIDEVLVQTTPRPLLRFYRWSGASVSFGYFGRFDEARTFAGGRCLVRRWTGGGIVPHGEDLTYSLIIPSRDAVYDFSSSEIYRRVHDALARSLHAEGIQTVLAQTNAPKITDSCFANPVVADVMQAGRKIAGAAQRKTRAGLLHQASIQRGDLGQRFRDSLAAGLSDNVVPDQITSAVLEAAAKLSTDKYATEAWLQRR